MAGVGANSTHSMASATSSNVTPTYSLASTTSSSVSATSSDAVFIIFIVADTGIGV